jgi:hypothetical protein
MLRRAKQYPFAFRGIYLLTCLFIHLFIYLFIQVFFFFFAPLFVAAPSVVVERTANRKEYPKVSQIYSRAPHLSLLRLTPSSRQVRPGADTLLGLPR